MPNPCRSSRIVVLTGAGVSAESGLATFRGASGLWENVRPKDLATPEAFAKRPLKVLAFYTARRRALLASAVAPNAAHIALAAFERRFRGEFLLVTQNVDDLHERAGSQKLRHMHGELLRTRCANCGHEFASTADISTADSCPACGRVGRLRPAVVWFGEMPLFMDEISAVLGRCDLFIAIGTSGQVYPAAGFVEIARRVGARTVEINIEKTTASSLFQESVRSPASNAVPIFLERIECDLLRLNG
jgi:NAD-dependent deacetylase